MTPAEIRQELIEDLYRQALESPDSVRQLVEDEVSRYSDSEVRRIAEGRGLLDDEIIAGSGEDDDEEDGPSGVLTDERGVPYILNARNATLPEGWAMCLSCYRAWNDAASTSVTPAPSGRCPFEYEHRNEDENHP